MTEKLRIAMIGTGGISRRHATGLASFEDVEFAGHYDVDAGRAEAMAADYGGQAFTDLAEMLDTVKPDAAWVCVPPFAHGPAEMALIQRRIPFLTEKPQHISLADARQIAEAIDKANLITSVGYMNRYRRSVARAKELIAQNPPALIHGSWIGGMPGVAWWRVKAQSGGQILEQTTHTVDLLRYIGGEAESVHALGATGIITDVPNYDVEDASSVLIRMKSGAVANIMSSCTSLIPASDLHLNFICRNLFVRLTDWSNDAYIRKSALEEEQIQGEDRDVIFALEDRGFVDAVKSGDRSTILCPYADGLETLRLCLAANESMATGKTVML